MVSILILDKYNGQVSRWNRLEIWNWTFLMINWWLLWSMSEYKVQIYWEGHKSLADLPLFCWHYLVASNNKWKVGQIFVAFSKYLNLWRQILKLWNLATFILLRKLFQVHCVIGIGICTYIVAQIQIARQSFFIEKLFI